MTSLPKTMTKFGPRKTKQVTQLAKIKWPPGKKLMEIQRK